MYGTGSGELVGRQPKAAGHHPVARGYYGPRAVPSAPLLYPKEVLTKEDSLPHRSRWRGRVNNHNKKNHDKVIIICPTHGQFLQAPIVHTSWNGCIDCAGIRKKTTEQFIEDAKLIHGERYDYSEVDYKNNRSIIKIKCFEHGVFEQQAKSHLKGSGCIICSGKNQKDTDTFIEEANLVHKGIYDYSD